ncbi:dTDP-4-dehydrorhamnose reductase [Caulobacter sp. 17J80-11]|uniref:dTDP-4-dehydrorhamnose reductase n=1 Tax=Caulobacter sp. 17J80-11 TaxID=2763502 RepID=UPI0016535879|nr:dTDP-4-dehydrorhamnose reductase [Caulobacter sp. 17J80-11]MBC6983656.1 dTDP-4-dehydrorhamnose reductase [Caulobacter sp. 17J80-11]
MSLRVLQFGSTGQIGRALVDQAARRDVEIVALDRSRVDLRASDAVARAVREAGPVDLVVNAAAFTRVDDAEAAEEEAFAVNAEAPQAMAEACARRDLPLVHFSTDYVFDGEKGAPYAEGDAPRPLNAYGRSKLAGERAVLAACPRALVVRVSWVFSPWGTNFFSWILSQAGRREPLRIVEDQIGRATSALDAAAFVLDLAPRLVTAPAGDPIFGLLHFANAGAVSRRAFAEELFALAGGGPPVEGVASAAFPAAAVRPLRAELGTGRLEREFLAPPRPWREAALEVLARRKG